MAHAKREFVLLDARPCDCCAAMAHVNHGTPLPKHLVRRRDRELGETIARRGSSHGDWESTIGIFRSMADMKRMREIADEGDRRLSLNCKGA